MNQNILKKIREKREFSQLSEKDIEMAYAKFQQRQASEEEKIKLAKELLRKIFSVFISKKLLSPKDKEPEWILRKHISTKERLPYYQEIYKRIFKNYKKASVIDLGAGINGFSYNFLPKNTSYTSIESVGQLDELMNFYFKKNKLTGQAVHLSLFEKEKVIEIIKKQKEPRIIFLFKVIDALEAIKKDYSKELISELAPYADRFAVSFPTKSLGNRQSFKAKRNWIVEFIEEKFEILDDFELGGERYLIFRIK
ncbi:Ribosomal RNA methyltransferase (FmrO) [uncultured archaeon]|nr:Ribosomal RNA methyltransferase (FmrO) [uncultured archaeon]